MTKIVCDICGKILDDQHMKIEYKRGREGYLSNFAAPIHLDCCDECFKKHFSVLYSQSNPLDNDEEVVYV